MFTAKEVYSFAMSLYGLSALLLQPKDKCDNEVWEKIPPWRAHYVIFQDSRSTYASWAPPCSWNPWELGVWLGSQSAADHPFIPPKDTNLHLQTSKAMPTGGNRQATPGLQTISGSRRAQLSVVAGQGDRTLPRATGSPHQILCHGSVGYQRPRSNAEDCPLLRYVLQLLFEMSLEHSNLQVHKQCNRLPIQSRDWVASDMILVWFSNMPNSALTLTFSLMQMN